MFLITGILRRACMAGGWIPLVVRLGTELNLSGAQLLMLGLSMEVAALVGEIPTGIVADTMSRKWSVVIAATLLAGAQFASGFGTFFWFFIVTQFVWGIGWAFLSGAEVAWITSELGSAAAAEPLILRRARLQFASTFLGIIGFAALGHFISMQFAVVVAGVIGLGWAVALAVLMPETTPPVVDGSRIEDFRTMLVTGARLTWNTRGLRLLGVTLLFGGMAAEAMDRMDIRRLADVGLSESISPIGVFAAIALAQAAVAGLVLWRWEDRFAGSRASTAFAVIVLLNGLAAIAIGSIDVLAPVAFLYFVQGGLLDLTDPLITTWTNAFAPDRVRATVHSFVGQTRALGEIGGGVILGIVASVSGVPLALIIAGGLFIVASTVAIRGRPEIEAALASPPT